MQILMLTQALCAILLAVSFDTDAKPNGLRINGGQDAEEDEFPFIVFLDVRMYEKHKNLGIIEKKLMHCAGSIITKYHVLTAAHCVNSELEPSRISKKSPYRVRPEDVFVYVGVHNKDDVDDLERSRKFKVAKINRHEQFDRASGFNDIALLTLKKSIKFHTSIGGKRFCLPPKLTNFRKGYTVTTVGWGHVNILGGLPSVLQKIKAEIISHENKMIFTDTMKGGHCQGDSGGPVIGKGGALVGIVSHSKLEGKPYCTAGVGIRDASTCVADYIDWISEKIRRKTC